MIFATVAIGVLLLIALLVPFWLGRGGLLQASASVNSQAQLLALKDALLKAYLKDELAFTAGALPGPPRRGCGRGGDRLRVTGAG